MNENLRRTRNLPNITAINTVRRIRGPTMGPY